MHLLVSRGRFRNSQKRTSGSQEGQKNWLRSSYLYGRVERGGGWDLSLKKRDPEKENGAAATAESPVLIVLIIYNIVASENWT